MNWSEKCKHVYSLGAKLNKYCLKSNAYQPVQLYNKKKFTYQPAKWQLRTFLFAITKLKTRIRCCKIIWNNLEYTTGRRHSISQIILNLLAVIYSINTVAHVGKRSLAIGLVFIKSGFIRKRIGFESSLVSIFKWDFLF